MFAISHEVPMCLLQESRKFNDYDYALVHLFERDFKYYEFYQESLDMGRRVILDNSAYELGEPFDVAKYRAYVQTLKPTEYILPDYRDDAFKNLSAIKKWVPVDSLKRIGVVHGETYEIFCQNYRDIQPYVDKIAISADSFFFNGDIHPTLARVSVIEKMVRDGVINEDLPHHILGALSPTEYLHFVRYDWIESADTSNPVLHGLLGLQYEGERGLEEKSSTKLDSIMFHVFTEENIEKVYYNVKWFRNQFKKDSKSSHRVEEERLVLKERPVIQLVPGCNKEVPANSPILDTCPERYSSRKVHGMDVIDLAKFWGLNFNEGSILKYLLRDKGEDISDMDKIVVFAQRELKFLQETAK